ncbi:MAG TPA: hypothetical protein VLB45_05535 [Nitrosopumilaceae archaeon]|nr:hypothetical protein [Nitrosopumilaceae archaeon]
MKIIDVLNPKRIDREPDKTVTLLSEGKFVEQGIVVKKIMLCLYIQKHDKKLGPYSLVTALIETDKGEIEMTYDEGYRGENALEEAAGFLTSNLGLSGLILRSIIQLKAELEKPRK